MSKRYNGDKELKFVRLGRVVATPGAIEVLTDSETAALLRRHVHGDWGDVCASDAALNDEALRKGYRIMSVYTIGQAVSPDIKVWIITEADRSVTTILLPEEY